ncbi:MAG: hypothetical protein KDD47_07585, partial [Acidobacteria bacterium]|nr:hypothetical protein [Acidobacteriota bacterium]
DLARWLADGRILHLGRLDHQVKLRGFRIEVGEIETALRRLPEVQEAAVVTAGKGDGRRLVAFVQKRSGAPGDPNPRRLKESLAATLPEYMVPAAFTVLDVLPVLANSKLNRRALIARAETDLAALPEDDGTEAIPNLEDPQEALLGGLFAEVLEVDAREIGPGSDFFLLGGNSLAANRLITLIRDSFGVEIPLAELFSRPTVSSLRTAVSRLRTEEPPPPPPRPVDRSQPLPLSLAQRRLWVLYQVEGPSADYNMAGALELRGALDTAVLEQALARLVARHEALRTRFSGRSPEASQVVEEAGAFVLLRVDLSGLRQGSAGAELPAPARDLLAQHAVTPFDLETGPLFRAALLRLAPEHHLLLLNVHHIVFDGASAGILLRELSGLYQALLEGPEAIRGSGFDSPPSLQLADFAAWQRETFRGEVLGRQLDFWKQQLDGAPETLDLPFRQRRERSRSPRGAEVAFRLDDRQVEGLRKLAARTR